MQKIKLKNARPINPSEKVRIYRNLNNGLLSVQNMKGIVIAHLETVLLRDAKFVVRKKGRERVIKEKRKNVHAFVVGFYIETQSTAMIGRKITYNPYKYTNFVDENENPVLEAKRVFIKSSGDIRALNIK